MDSSGNTVTCFEVPVKIEDSWTQDLENLECVAQEPSFFKNANAKDTQIASAPYKNIHFNTFHS